MRTLIWYGAAITMLASIVSAHGGETMNGEAERDFITPAFIILGSAILSIGTFIFIKRSNRFDLDKIENLIVSLTVFTASVHLAIGITDYILFIGGILALAVTIPMLFDLKWMEGKERYHMFGFMGLLVLMFLAYFYVHGGLFADGNLDFLGMITKGIELMIILLLVRVPQLNFSAKKFEFSDQKVSPWQIASAVSLVLMLLLATTYPSLGISDGSGHAEEYVWIDPVTEIEDENHSHSDLPAHKLYTPNMKLIDYHNLNCDGEMFPPPEFDDTNGRPCNAESKNTAPTPGDNSEVSIEGNFDEGCVIHADGSGGCYAYVSAYNQFHILDISKPNDIQMLSTYYAETARMIDIKVTSDNNWVLVNHELTNTELDPIPNDDDANSGANRLDVIFVGDKTSPVKVAEWNNPPAGFHNQDIQVYCDWDGAIDPREECSLFLFGADPLPEIIAGGFGYKGTQVFYVPLGFESWIPNQNDEQQNSSREIIRWGGYSPTADTGCGGTIFNHDNIISKHPITGQILLYAAYWDAGLRIIDISNPPSIADPLGTSWPQNEEIGRWLGCSTDSEGWYGPDGGGHANMSDETWKSSADGNGWIHYVIPYDHLICEGIWEGAEKPWPSNCGTGPDDSQFGINWRHITLIAPEYGTNDNHTGWMRTIDTTDPTKPFLISEWKLPGQGTLPNGSKHDNHYIPGGYIYSPHNADTGLNGNVYFANYHAGAWVTNHGMIWSQIEWENGYAEPERGWMAIEQMPETETVGYFLPSGPSWMDDPKSELEYDMADCWASCMIPFDWGLQFDPRGFIIISEMVSGLYVVQVDEDRQENNLFPSVHKEAATEEED